VAEARALAAAEGTVVDFRERDVFALAREPERYQLVLEHTCFCAIDPTRRADYARVVADVLEPGGTFVALFWLHGRPGGPPFTTSNAEIDSLFAADFEVVERETPGDSVATRMGQELLVTYRRR
jgi:SAM-dependent methyltransferase